MFSAISCILSDLDDEACIERVNLSGNLWAHIYQGQGLQCLQLLRNGMVVHPEASNCRFMNITNKTYEVPGGSPQDLYFIITDLCVYSLE